MVGTRTPSTKCTTGTVEWFGDRSSAGPNGGSKPQRSWVAARAGHGAGGEGLTRKSGAFACARSGLYPSGVLKLSSPGVSAGEVPGEASDQEMTLLGVRILACPPLPSRVRANGAPLSMLLESNSGMRDKATCPCHAWVSQSAKLALARERCSGIWRNLLARPREGISTCAACSARKRKYW